MVGEAFLFSCLSAETSSLVSSVSIFLSTSFPGEPWLLFLMSSAGLAVETERIRPDLLSLVMGVMGWKGSDQR